MISLIEGPKIHGSKNLEQFNYLISLKNNWILKNCQPAIHINLITNRGEEWVMPQKDLGFISNNGAHDPKDVNSST